MYRCKCGCKVRYRQGWNTCECGTAFYVSNVPFDTKEQPRKPLAQQPYSNRIL